MLDRIAKSGERESSGDRGPVSRTNSKSTKQMRFVDRRHAVIARQGLQEQVTSSPKIDKIAQYQRLADRSPSPMGHLIQRTFGGSVVQRHAFWPVDGQNVVANPVPVANQPNYPFIKRDGGNQDHELYNGIRKARAAARGQANIKISKSITRTDHSGNQAWGLYRYGVEDENQLDTTTAQGEYRLRRDTNCVINHTQDNQAELELHTGANANQQTNPVNHFHAYRLNANTNIKHPQNYTAQPVGNRLGREHYFVNPFC